MKTIACVCAVVLALVASETGLLAQPPDTLWTRTFGAAGSDGALCVRQTWDGGFIAAGSTSSFGVWGDAWLIRINAQGDSIWSRNYGGLDEDVANSVLQTADSGLVFAGYTRTSPAGCDGWLVRTNAAGDTLWTRRLVHNHNEMLTSVQPTEDGGYVLTGYLRAPASGYYDGWLIRTNAAGDTLWTRTFGGVYEDCFYEACETFDGGFVAAGYGGSNRCFWLVKTNGNGDCLWSRTFCAPSSAAVARSLQQTADSGFVIAGWGDVRSTGTFDFWLIKTDASGDSLWSRVYGGNADDFAYCVRTTRDGGFVLCGGTGYGTPSGIRVIRTNAAGDSLWGLAFDEIEGHARCVEVTTDGGYILAGYATPIGSANSDLWLMRLALDVSSAGNSCSLHPSSFILSVFPNPFNPVTEIAYDLAKAGRVSLRVFDLLGREVAVLKDGFAEAGSHRITFDGGELSSGIYICRLQAGTRAESRKLVLIR